MSWHRLQHHLPYKLVHRRQRLKQEVSIHLTLDLEIMTWAPQQKLHRLSRNYKPSVSTNIKGLVPRKAKPGMQADTPPLPITNSVWTKLISFHVARVSRKGLSRVLPHIIQAPYSHNGNPRNCFPVCYTLYQVENSPLTCWTFEIPEVENTKKNIKRSRIWKCHL